MLLPPQPGRIFFVDMYESTALTHRFRVRIGFFPSRSVKVGYYAPTLELYLLRHLVLGRYRPLPSS